MEEELHSLRVAPHFFSVLARAVAGAHLDSFFRRQIVGIASPPNRNR
jgi:hypothetical protein